MVTIKDRILLYLQSYTAWVDDDQLAEALELSRRQVASSNCRKLETSGLIVRCRVNGKIRNFLVTDGIAIPPEEMISHDDRPWYWEAHIQDSVVRFLEESGYSITKCCNTATREPGKDIESVKAGRQLWVTVKGYPNGTKRTRATTQAGHWFKQAMFDIIAWRGESPTAELALALPDYPRYRSLAQRVKWLQPIVGHSIYWVDQRGGVSVETSDNTKCLNTSGEEVAEVGRRIRLQPRF